MLHSLSPREADPSGLLAEGVGRQPVVLHSNTGPPCSWRNFQNGGVAIQAPRALGICCLCIYRCVMEGQCLLGKKQYSVLREYRFGPFPRPQLCVRLCAGGCVQIREQNPMSRSLMTRTGAQYAVNRPPWACFVIGEARKAGFGQYS